MEKEKVFSYTNVPDYNALKACHEAAASGALGI
jgi:hypothetical protein